MLKTVLYFFLFFGVLYAEEVSVFGAGNLETPKPYGLTSTEKYILKNKNKLKETEEYIIKNKKKLEETEEYIIKNKKKLEKTEEYIIKNKKKLKETKKQVETIDTKVKSVKASIEYINERIDGLESIYEGDSQRLQSAIIKINNILKEIETNKNQLEFNKINIEQNKINIENIKENEIKNIKNILNQLITMQEQNSEAFTINIKNLKSDIEKSAKLLNEINSNYIANKEFEKNMKQFITKQEFEDFKKLLTKDLAKLSKKIKASSKVKSSKSKKELMNEARKLFKKNHFTKLIPILEDLISNKYRPAECNYYLGEIWFYRKKYKDAIHYFKTSALLYDKAKYMPKLMLHSAIAFEKTDDLDNAATFYNSLIEMYPNSSEAKEAQKHLSKN